MSAARTRGPHRLAGGLPSLAATTGGGPVMIVVGDVTALATGRVPRQPWEIAHALRA